MPQKNLRIAFLAGTLDQGGAEKQLFYIASGLKNLGFEVHVFSLTSHGYYKHKLEAIQIPVTWVGRFKNPILRLLDITREVYKFHPHIFQAGHFFTNLYISLLPLISTSTISIGSIRSNVFYEIEANGNWGYFLIKAPHILLANSYIGSKNAIAHGIHPSKVYMLPNVIDLESFDNDYASSVNRLHPASQCVVVTVANLYPVKRLDRYINALALARHSNPHIVGWIIGEGPERHRLEKLAQSLNLMPDGIRFWGLRDNIPALLSQAHIFVLTSEQEGFPNVLLEAMAAKLPIISTNTGDVAHIIEHGKTGYLTKSDIVKLITDYIILLSNNSNLREELGANGRQRVENNYSLQKQASHLLNLYLKISKDHHKYQISKIITEL